MGLLNNAKSDWKRFSSDLNLFGVTITLVAPNSETATVVGTATKHSIGIDENGQSVNTDNAHCTISEELIVEANASYPIRNAKGIVSMKKHEVKYNDANGTEKTYEVSETMPDETVGVITFILVNRG